ncbi:hypothetical protein [Candidatus Nitrosocosmicus sp. T]
MKRELDDTFKAYIVQLIIDKKTEQALESLSRFYEIKPPQIVVGTIKGKRKTVYAVYVQRESKIYCINSDIFYNPFIIMHEFYHHLRTTAGIHKGSEKHANMYARDFVDSYKIIMNGMMAKTKDI